MHARFLNKAIFHNKRQKCVPAIMSESEPQVSKIEKL